MSSPPKYGVFFTVARGLLMCRYCHHPEVVYTISCSNGVRSREDEESKHVKYLLHAEAAAKSSCGVNEDPTSRPTTITNGLRCRSKKRGANLLPSDDCQTRRTTQFLNRGAGPPGVHERRLGGQNGREHMKDASKVCPVCICKCNQHYS